MKIKSNPKNKTLLAAHNTRIVHDRQTYIVRAQTLGTTLLADAEPWPQGGIPINLFGKDKLAKALRGLVESHLYS
jgi:hypothetical protein